MKTVLITGGAKGIGRACAIEFDRQGFQVIVSYHTSKQEAQALCNEYPTITSICADLTKADQVSEMLAKAYQTAKKIDVLVNNAGMASQKLFTDISEQEWDEMFATNMKSMFLVTKGVLPNMIQNRYGKIVNISSIWGITGASCEVHYSASKAAVIGFTKALAKEVGLSKINVNCVAPGVVMTDMNKALSEETLVELIEETPLQQLGTPEQIASVVAFLASDQAQFITGQIISPNGGIVI